MTFNFRLALEGKIRIIDIEKILDELIDRNDISQVHLRVLEKRFTRYVCAFKDEPECEPALKLYCHIYNGIAGNFNNYLGKVKER